MDNLSMQNGIYTTYTQYVDYLQDNNYPSQINGENYTDSISYDTETNSIIVSRDNNNSIGSTALIQYSDEIFATLSNITIDTNDSSIFENNTNTQLENQNFNNGFKLSYSNQNSYITEAMDLDGDGFKEIENLYDQNTGEKLKEYEYSSSNREIETTTTYLKDGSRIVVDKNGDSIKYDKYNRPIKEIRSHNGYNDTTTWVYDDENQTVYETYINKNNEGLLGFFNQLFGITDSNYTNIEVKDKYIEAKS